MSDAARWKATVYVGGLAAGVTPTILREAFLPFGEIVDVSFPRNDPHANAPKPQAQAPPFAGGGAGGGDAHRGFAYVEFEDPDDAREAVDNMDQAELFGKVIRVSAAKAPKSATAQGLLNARTAVWEQEGWLAEHAVSEEDKQAAEMAKLNSVPEDPMQGLEGLDVAGPKPE
ncbi:hypothetical protein VTJ83DRAFT_6498 [Remersonia thermophila]|uniref:RRM domain-containing protein n=1 Tax=Remersonia thermophila TaxID=72144 RepID=A0ABR4D4W2_9PEZI